MFYNGVLEEKFIQLAIKNRETCHHWINYDIYDSLSDDLKIKYIDQFECHRLLIFTDDNSIKVSCRANRKDLPNFNFLDCTDKYENTAKEFMQCQII